MYDFDTIIDRSQTGASKWIALTPQEIDQGILPLSVADMEFAAPPCVRQALEKAVRHGIYGYTHPDQAYYAAVLGWMERRYNLKAAKEDLFPTNGVVPALGLAIRAMTRPGDGVIVQPPIYPPFLKDVERNGRRLELCPLALDDEGYRMDFEALEKAARKDDVKLMLLCSPHNPVGRVWTREELIRVDEICRENGVVVVSDEIHADLIHKGPHTCFAALSPQARQNVILCTAPSKTFNVPGLQNANIFVFNPEIREAFGRQVSLEGSDCVPYFGYAATIAAYTGGAGWLEEALAYIRGNYQVLEDFLKENFPAVRLFPMEGTYLAWADFRSLGLDEKELEHLMRVEAHLLLGQGFIFGKEGSGFERINLALPRKALIRQLNMLKEAWQKRCAK